MSEPKVQLIDPQGNISLPGMNATGVITASSFSGGGGVVTELTANANLNVGVVTATSFVGDGTGHAAGLTGTPNLNLGLTTATSFIGDAVGKAAGLTGTPNLNVGLITATSFAGNVTGDVTGNITGLAASITPGNNLNVGVVTAIQWHGNGANLTGAGSSAYIAQEITASDNASSETIIDLSDGNLIYFTQTTKSTTVGFASTSPAEQITLIRDTSPVTPSFATGAVDMDGTGDWLTLEQTNDLAFGTGDFTMELWVYLRTGGYTALIDCRPAPAATEGLYPDIYYDGTSQIHWFIDATQKISGDITIVGQWNHVAVSRSGTSTKMFVNGTQVGSTYSDSNNYLNGDTTIGTNAQRSGSGNIDGFVSNVRIVKGTALYTSDFDAPFYELTNVTNTELLCCQSDSSTTASAVTPGTITAAGDPTAGSQTITSSSSVTPSITWPNTVKWSNNDVAPTLLEKSGGFQIIRFTTADTGATYYGWSGAESPEGNRLFMWGVNERGQLGQNSQGPSSNGSRSSPVQVGTEYTWSSQAMSSGMGMGIKTDNTMWVWGISMNGGELGLNEGGYVWRSSPTQLGTDATWNSFVTGYSGNAAYENVGAIKTDGSLWMWGSQTYGQLGVNNRTQYSSPVQLPGTWDKQAIGENSTAQIKDGKLYMAGRNNEGGLGQNETTQRSSPTQVGTDTTWANIDLGDYGTASFGVKTDGTLWSWGYNTGNALGILGQNNQTNYSSPRQVGTDTTWSTADDKIAVTYRTISAIKTDGSLWSWGSNYYGMCGANTNGSTINAYSSPVQVGNKTDWSSCARGKNNGYAINTDGELWGWGRADLGALGQNNLTNVSSPVQIPGTWTNVRGADDAAAALRL